VGLRVFHGSTFSLELRMMQWIIGFVAKPLLKLIAKQVDDRIDTKEECEAIAFRIYGNPKVRDKIVSLLASYIWKGHKVVDKYDGD
jgi:hypothetical protein